MQLNALPTTGFGGRIAGVADCRVLGVDVCRAGLVAVALTEQGYCAAYLASNVEELLTRIGPVAVVGVDIPIGLPTRSARAADLEARKFVGPRLNSVFVTPVRAAVLEEDYRQALDLSRKLAGQGMSLQAHSLRRKAIEVEKWLSRTSQLCVVEAHPEVSFTEMAGRPLQTTKKSWAGAVERRDLLLSYGIELPVDLGDAGRAGIDDVLDAAAIAWTARRVALDPSVGHLPRGIYAIPGRTRCQRHSNFGSGPICVRHVGVSSPGGVSMR